MAHNLNNLYKSIVCMLGLFFKGPDTHVRISELGREILNNKKLASKIAEAIVKHKTDLEEGKSFSIDSENEEIEIELVTSIKDVQDGK